MNFAFESHLPGIRSAPGPAPPLLRLMLIFYSHPALAPVSHCASAENVVLPHFLHPRSDGARSFNSGRRAGTSAFFVCNFI